MRIVTPLALIALSLALWPPDARAEEPSELAQEGLWSLRNQGCGACHSTDGTRGLGPTLLGLYGAERAVVSGGEARVVRADEAYLLRSLEAPDADVVEGFPPGMMPAIALEPGEAGAVVAALRHLGGEPPAREGRLWPLLLGLALFVGGHLGLSSMPVRARLIARLGEKGFTGLYSLVVLIGFALSIVGYIEAPHIPLWQHQGWFAYVPLLTMPFIYTLAVVGFTTKNPASFKQEGRLADPRPVGVVAITRHPGNWSIGLWGLVHLLPNGDVAGVLFFGGFAALSFLGMLHIDRRRRLTEGAAWEAFAAQTSLMPFAAMLQGRARLHLGEIGAARIAGGLGGYALVLWLHPFLFGASPWPF